MTDGAVWAGILGRAGVVIWYVSCCSTKPWKILDLSFLGTNEAHLTA